MDCTGYVLFEGAARNNTTRNSGTQSKSKTQFDFFLTDFLFFAFPNQCDLIFWTTWLDAKRKKWNEWIMKKLNAALGSCGVFRFIY